jgi:hypothetical protein
MPLYKVNAYMIEAFSIVINPFIGFAGRTCLFQIGGDLLLFQPGTRWPEEANTFSLWVSSRERSWNSLAER